MFVLLIAAAGQAGSYTLKLHYFSGGNVAGNSI